MGNFRFWSIHYWKIPYGIFPKWRGGTWQIDVLGVVGISLWKFPTTGHEGLKFRNVTIEDENSAAPKTPG